MSENDREMPKQPEILHPIQGMYRDGMRDFRPRSPEVVAAEKKEAANNVPLGVRVSVSTSTTEDQSRTSLSVKQEDAALAAKVTPSPTPPSINER